MSVPCSVVTTFGFFPSGSMSRGLALIADASMAVTVAE